MRAQKTGYYTQIFYVSACVYSWFIVHALCVPFGWAGGYPLTFPLLPVVVACPLLATMVWCGGKWFLVWCVVYGIQVAVVARASFFVRLLLLLLVTWCIVHVCVSHKTVPITVVCPVLPVYKKRGLEQLAAAQQALQQAYAQYPDACAYLLPESAVPFDYKKVSYVVHAVTDQVGIDNSPVLFGTHRCQEGITYNSLACAYNGRITVGYVKKRLVPVFEEPHIIELFLKRSLLLTKKTAFSAGPENQEPLYISGLGYFLPLICSEALGVYSYQQTFPLLVMVHDGHFRHQYIKRLIKAYVQLQAGTRCLPLIYSSYAQE